MNNNNKNKLMNVYESLNEAPSFSVPTSIKTPKDFWDAWNLMASDIRSMVLGYKFIKQKFPDMDIEADLKDLNQVSDEISTKLQSKFQDARIAQKNKIPTPGSISPEKSTTGSPPSIPGSSKASSPF